VAEAVGSIVGDTLLSHSSPARPLRNQANIARPAPVGTLRRHVRFAHPAEASIANLLDSWHIPWEYEPTTFPLLTGPNGAPLQSITPDFYLPRHDIYIEMTTMRQSLVTRKNRKFRLLRERYPELNVRLLYRRDVELIVERYGRGESQGAEPGTIVAGAELIQRRTDDIVSTLAGPAPNQAPTIVALGVNALPFATQVTESWSNHASGGAPTLVCLAWERINAWVEFSLSAAIEPASPVVLVTDVVGTGLTAHAASTWLRAQSHDLLAVIALADRGSARLLPLPDLLSVVHAPSSWLTGAGVGGNSRPDLHLCQDKAAAS
jgi:hypothetical protein